MEETIFTTAAIILGVLLRFGLPIGLTLLLGWFLRRLDAKWTAEAAAEVAQDAARAAVEPDLKCWEVHNCPPRLRANCPAFAQPETPCYELFRINGRLKPACRDCRVARRAAAPVIIPI